MAREPVTREQCFEQLLLGKAVESTGWLAGVRVEALARARDLNFPSERHEDWRLTDLSALLQHSFQPVDSSASVTLADIERFLIPGTVRLVFVDGCHMPQLSNLTQAGAGVTVSSLV